MSWVNITDGIRFRNVNKRASPFNVRKLRVQPTVLTCVVSSDAFAPGQESCNMQKAQSWRVRHRSLHSFSKLICRNPIFNLVYTCSTAFFKAITKKKHYAWRHFRIHAWQGLEKNLKRVLEKNFSTVTVNWLWVFLLCCACLTLDGQAIFHNVCRKPTTWDNRTQLTDNTICQGLITHFSSIWSPMTLNSRAENLCFVNSWRREACPAVLHVHFKWPKRQSCMQVAKDKKIQVWCYFVQILFFVFLLQQHFPERRITREGGGGFAVQ